MALKLELLHEEKKAGKLSFMITGSDEVFTNTIRRLVVEEVPTLAVEDVEIKENNSALYDEMLALRLGLVPIKTDLKSYRFPENEDEIMERSARCTLQLRLKSSKKGYVYAEQAESSDPKCTFAIPQMPIVKLLAKQKVDVTMVAILGRGKDHTKWAPGWAFFNKEVVIKMGDIRNPELVAKKSSDGVFTLKTGKLILHQDKVHQSRLLEYYAELDEGITISYSDNFIFNLESWGQLPCREILTLCSEILIEKAQELEKLI